MSNSSDNPWIELIRKVRTTGPPAESPDMHPPEFFVSRVRAMRARLWEYARLLLWRRWSLILLAVAVLGYLLAHAMLRTDTSRVIPVPSPPKLFTE